MSKITPCAAEASTLSKPEQALLLLDVLGKDPEKTWFRFLKVKGSAQGRDLQGFEALILNKSRVQAYPCFLPGDAEKASGNGGGVTNSDVTSMRALFTEWDDQTLEWQLNAWRELSLPEPTIMVHTGGKSIHVYWALAEPIGPDIWRQYTKRLIQYCNSDPSISNPSRMMRLPGSRYIDKKTGELKGWCEVVRNSGHRYTLGDFDKVLPPLGSAITGDVRDKGSDFEARTEDEIEEAATYVPIREGSGNGTYRTQDWPALCGCAGAYQALGYSDEESIEKTLVLMVDELHKWPDRAEAEQKIRSARTWAAGSFFKTAQQNGYEMQPGVLKTSVKPHKARRSKPKRLSHKRRMDCLEKCVRVQAVNERNSFRRRARLLKVVKDLDLKEFINRAEITQRVMEAKEEGQGNLYNSLSSDERRSMDPPVVEWLIPNVLPAGDLTIIGGRPKVGKTRLAVALVAAVINGTNFAGFGEPQKQPRVVLVSDDQSDGDTRAMLEAHGIWDHAFLLWSPRFRLTEVNLDRLLTDVKDNPGALVVIDSLRSICRALAHGENDAEIGATIYDLKEAVVNNGGTLVLIHHCNKTNDLVGVEALSGHSAIAGAANTVLTLHYCPDAKGQADKSNRQRRLVREARSGLGCDFVIAADGKSASYRRVSTYGKWQQQLMEAKKHAKDLDALTPLQKQVLDSLTAEPQTLKQVCAAAGVEWRISSGGKEKAVSRALARLVDVGVAKKHRGSSENTYRLSEGE